MTFQSSTLTRDGRGGIASTDLDDVPEARSHPRGNRVTSTCAECKSTYTTLRELEQHAKRAQHSAFECQVLKCGRRYKDRSACSRHKAWHEEPSIVCSFCKRRFHRLDNLNEHLQLGRCKTMETIQSLPDVQVPDTLPSSRKRKRDCASQHSDTDSLPTDGYAGHGLPLPFTSEASRYDCDASHVASNEPIESSPYSHQLYLQQQKWDQTFAQYTGRFHSNDEGPMAPSVGAPHQQSQLPLRTTDEPRSEDLSSDSNSIWSLSSPGEDEEDEEAQAASARLDSNRKTCPKLPILLISTPEAGVDETLFVQAVSDLSRLVFMANAPRASSANTNSTNINAANPCFEHAHHRARTSVARLLLMKRDTEEGNGRKPNLATGKNIAPVRAPGHARTLTESEAAHNMVDSTVDSAHKKHPWCISDTQYTIERMIEADLGSFIRNYDGEENNDEGNDDDDHEDHHDGHYDGCDDDDDDWDGGFMFGQS